MSTSYLSQCLDYIKVKNPIHYKKVKKNVYFNDPKFEADAEVFFESYTKLLAAEGKDLNYALDSYLKFCNDVMFEQMRFLETGKYTSTSFEEVNKRVYDNPEVMSYYMHGLLVSQYLWEHHYRILEFFFKNVGKYQDGIKNVLEVGGGHGLYTNEINARFNFDFKYTMVDISETSIAMSKTFVKSDKMNYILHDIYTYQTDTKYDFIIMGEVLEHVEEPLRLMKILHSLGSDNCTAFITAPCNSPAIDHISLFRNPQELKDLFNEAGWDISLDLIAPSETKDENTRNYAMIIPEMYAVFLKKKKS